jgi:hypothetical protein
MNRRLVTLALSLLLVGVVAAGSLTLMAKPGGAGKGGFQPCPFPPCMAPCIFPAPEEVRCKSAEGEVTVTSYTCCCCGGSGSSFKWLK